MLGFLKRLLGGGGDDDSGLDVAELARRLQTTEAELRGIRIEYATFQIPKRSGGTRTIAAPSAALKALQRRILHRLLAKLAAHPCATGFESGHSIVTNALPHAGRDVVIRLDLKDFFTTTTSKRVDAYFRGIGWHRDAAALLARLCTWQGALPQGAPTSPRLSNLVNHKLDARLSALAEQRGAACSRYADDITISGTESEMLASPAKTGRLNDLIHLIKLIVKEEGYTLHTDKKLRIHRRHDRQLVTGLVVNIRPNLPRSTRRRLRAIRHRLAAGGRATLSEQQLAGWEALEKMIAMQSRSPRENKG